MIWAPGTKLASLVGGFNNGKPNATVLTRDEFGVWKTLLPNNTAGSAPTPHDSIGEAYVFKHPQLKRPKYLMVPESHIDMSDLMPFAHTHENFKDDMLPCIQGLDYSAVQVMAIQEPFNFASLGYHVTNRFAPRSCPDTPKELKSLMNRAHELGPSSGKWWFGVNAPDEFPILVIGQVKVGEMYKARYSDNSVAVVKSMSRGSEPTKHGFYNEIMILARLLHCHLVVLRGLSIEKQQRTSNIQLGYTDPKYVITQELSDNSDVYSYGELVTTKQAIQNSKNVVEWTREFMGPESGLPEFVDPHMEELFHYNHLKTILRATRRCTQNGGRAGQRKIQSIIAILKARRGNCSGVDVAMGGSGRGGAEVEYRGAGGTEIGRGERERELDGWNIRVSYAIDGTSVPRGGFGGGDLTSEANYLLTHQAVAVSIAALWLSWLFCVVKFPSQEGFAFVLWVSSIADLDYGWMGVLLGLASKRLWVLA
ncbi:hypothetical protein Nepgr_009887 [Nepenthes gracilis]|uniref:Uncharacterized protein n=1 Tax=Nepenthes gracilis TaxID=150966 RepID=A0AAD3SBJ8_NEPGR|nr:hypothetical protein Nepgr_009887 [Nepenthes gracilis]